jgi:hypothetical protein
MGHTTESVMCSLMFGGNNLNSSFVQLAVRFSNEFAGKKMQIKTILL